jgi:hypothetical protein
MSTERRWLMPIEDRNLEAGTRLVAKYKGQTHSAEVVETEEGLRYRLEDGREFKSPSAAGSAVMGGVACNGWRFWSLEGQEPAAKEPKPKGKSKRGGANGAKTACGECRAEFLSAVEASDHVAKEHPGEEAPTA